MIDWDSFLAAPANSGVQPLTQPDISDLQKSAAKAGLAIFALDFTGVTEKRGFLETLARGMHFPSYFGHNWDALEDCLTDLSWCSAAGFVLLMSNFRGFNESAPTDSATAQAIFHDTALFWKDAGILFFIALAEE
jgi:hypothetical protein